ncbi:hypothetical protein DesLBE_3392 [Desulfitobacterium sp. LBE]|uniref:Uncharacterized protein n=2 Tax=root TaxID=1 RepID=B8G0K4_DESHD|nr:hypothetical protein Dhaf_4947 [Desulfitobacterium hafniense DCB-2]TWH59027.1 hypothetical protein DesLBE_3392 [Desulfitobacterium sp. LBE]
MEGPVPDSKALPFRMKTVILNKEEEGEFPAA